MRQMCIIGCLLVLLVQAQAQILEIQPQQVHLAYGESSTDMTVTWVTLNPTESSIVEYGHGNLQMFTKGHYTTFVDGGSEQRKLYMHRVILTGLEPGSRYVYHVGCPDAAWSELFSFRAMNEGSNWRVRLAVYGDLGDREPHSLSRLQEDTQRGMYDAILHIGDMAYNMDDDNALRGDSFMRQVQAVAAYVPYMTCVGNHEYRYNFSNYKARFSMPKAGGDGQNIFYSFNVGPAHIIAFSTEVLYYTVYGTAQIYNQLKWLKNDLAKANLPENRAKQPWLITMGHRPMYCSNSDHDDCTVTISKTRAHLEELFYEQGVDLALWAHEHSYERLFPLYNMTMCNGSDEAPYTNPTSPVHLITGSAGCIGHHDGFGPLRPPWSAYRSDDYGYSRMTIINSTNIYIEQVSDDKDGAIIDQWMLIKEKHGAGTYTCHKKPQLGSKPWYREKRQQEKTNSRTPKEHPNMIRYETLRETQQRAQKAKDAEQFKQRLFRAGGL